MRGADCADAAGSMGTPPRAAPNTARARLDSTMRARYSKSSSLPPFAMDWRSGTVSAGVAWSAKPALILFVRYAAYAHYTTMVTSKRLRFSPDPSELSRHWQVGSATLLF